ncbi:MAG TPA: class I SAM-dependent methyltransferase [Phenylobacterium sp.]|uniref:class I SAM-dependent methyltransferase n=1 Tax=Phenylobacterium sp. TaxID=1871053 RepID=UPI002CBAB374|nr:class I SAM-dependent methyltransferase [Phenylobacterium sp.]HSV02129.1 class I SAM-dependent methyltransferase [Phenylobacterium sp.]
MIDKAPASRRGSEFADADVVGSYANRTPYPAALCERLAALTPARGRALDLGCGPGKLAIPLADLFGEIVAVDPSRAMIAAARAADAGRHGAIRWVLSLVEDADLAGSFDLAVAGASIHWMEHRRLFPKLADALAPEAPLVVVGGDGPAEAPWIDAYRAVIVSWVERLGGEWNSPEFVAAARAHEAWIDLEGRDEVWGDCRMPIEALIDGEHSRATWTRAKLGPERAAAFDADLRAVLTPHAEDGLVSFRTRATLLWGRPRREPKADLRPQ